MDEMTVRSTVMVILAAHELPAIWLMQSISDWTLATKYVAAADDTKPEIRKTLWHFHQCTRAVVTARGRRSWEVHYRFFHPPRLPGAPPVERGAGPNSGPDSRELVGWMILLLPPKGLAGSLALGR
ncbi:hypothetical protein ACVIJ6_000732 [Bradyrhizobium sp. USDA 4369]